MSELSPTEDPDPHPAGLELVEGLPYLQIGLNEAERTKHSRTIESNARRLATVAVSGVYFNIASFSGSEIEWSCVEADGQEFIGKLEPETGPYEVEYDADGTRFIATAIGVAVAGRDWKIFVPTDSLSALYLHPT